MNKERTTDLFILLAFVAIMLMGAVIEDFGLFAMGSIFSLISILTLIYKNK